MNRKGFNGKAIYNPLGKAGEYSEWACNFYTGCSNNCEYCYCKKGYMGRIWSETPKLKKCFTNEDHALEVFKKEMMQNLDRLQKSGLFFTFTSDPMLPETKELTWAAIAEAIMNNVPVQVLTKRADFIDDRAFTSKASKMIAFGFTLTGHDELEPGASTNKERMIALIELHNRGFRTFASIEPVVDFVSAFSMINITYHACDLYKIGLMSGKKYNATDRTEANFMLDYLRNMDDAKFYLKDSLVSLLGLDRAILPGQFVGKDYNRVYVD